MRILITGGAGYLGSILVPKLLRQNYNVTVYDNLMYNQLSLLEVCNDKNFNFVYGDVRNTSLLIKELKKSDIVIPLAAIVGFPACDRDKQLATHVNFIHIKNIVDNISKNQMVLYPNSNSGYGIGKFEKIYTEENLLNPISHYGITKCNAEDYLKNNSDAVILRLATVFGISPRMRLDLLVNEFVYKAITDKYITVFEKDLVRNYIHVRDVAHTFNFMIDNYDKYNGEIFNVGLSDSNINKEELVNKITKFVPDFAVTFSDYYKDPDKRDYVVSNEKIESVGWKPKYSLDDGIEELIKGYKFIVNNISNKFRNAFPLGYTIGDR